MKKRLALASLVEDFSLYPRNHVDEVHVSDLLRAKQAGQEFPPIIACADTLRIVDGIHRRRMFLKHDGHEATAMVELRKYKNDADLFLDAVALNSSHGRKLERHDHTRIVLRLRELQVDDQVISLSLHVPVAQVQLLSLRVVLMPDGEAMPSKRGLEHMRGQQMTQEQVDVIGSVRSGEAGRLALELTRLLDAGLVDLADDQIRQRLDVLTKSIASALRSVAA